MYNFIAYMGVLGLGLHLLRIVSAALLLVSAGAILDNLFVFNLLPNGGAINPVYFAGAVGSYLTLGALALFIVVPRSERAYIAPIVPVYFLYVLMHIAPITVGFGNWVALRLWGRRLYRDHYQSHEEDAAFGIKRPSSSASALRAPAAFHEHGGVGRRAISDHPTGRARTSLPRRVRWARAGSPAPGPSCILGARPVRVGARPRHLRGASST